MISNVQVDVDIDDTPFRTYHNNDILSILTKSIMYIPRQHTVSICI